MDLFLGLFLFVIGGAFGSFLNVLIDRLPKKKSIIFSRSVCENCHKEIQIIDLIPVISYILLKGRCRKCKAQIPPRIFITELTCAMLFPIVYFFAFVNFAQYILLLIIFLDLIAISVVDIEKGIIPDKLLIVFAVLSLIYLLIQNPQYLPAHLVTAFAAFAFFLAIFLITRGRGIGFGDVKLSFFIGFALSVPQLIIVFYAAFLTGALVSIILIILGIKKLKGESIPFGPFLSFGVIAALLFEKQIVEVVRGFINF